MRIRMAARLGMCNNAVVSHHGNWYHRLRLWKVTWPRGVRIVRKESISRGKVRKDPRHGDTREGYGDVWCESK